MGKKLSQETIDSIYELYDKLKSQAAVARQLNISASTVSKYLKLNNNNNNNETKQKRLTPEDIEQLNTLYSIYHNMSKVAKEMNITPKTVKTHLNEENLKILKKQSEDRDALFYYIIRLFGVNSEEQPVSNWNLTQMNKFKEQGMTYSGQLLTLKFFYEVEKNTTEKSKGSIGIIPYVYDRARLYYLKQAKRAVEINQGIQKQLEKDRLEIPYNPSNYFGKKKRKMIDLDSLKE